MRRKLIGLFATRGVVVGLNFASLLIVAAFMEPKEFGAFVFLWSAAQLLSGFASMGSVNYLMREGSARQGDPMRGVTRIEALRIAFGLPAAILAVCAGGALLIAAWVGDLAAFANVSALDILSVCAATGTLIALAHSATPLRLNDMQTASMLVRDAGPQSIILAVVAIDAFVGALTPAAVLLAFAGVGLALALTAITFGITRKTPLWRDEGGKRIGGQRGFWGSSIMGMGATQFDIFLGGFFLREEELGVYQIIKRLANLISMPQIIVNWALVVRLGKNYAEGALGAIRKDCQAGSFWGVISGMFLTVALIIAMPFIFDFYAVTDQSAGWIVFALLATSNLANLAFGLNLALAAQSNREHIAFMARTLGLGIGIAIVFASANAYGTWALAMAVLIGAIFTQSLAAWRIWKELQVDTTFVGAVVRRYR